MQDFFSRRYQRHKRIKRILSLQDGYDAYRPREPELSGFLLPNYTWARFFMTLALTVLVAIPSNYILGIVFSVLHPKLQVLITTPISMLIGFYAVEIVDDFYIRWEDARDEFKTKTLPYVAAFGVIFVYIALTNSSAFLKPFEKWKSTIAYEYREPPIPIVAFPNQGLNWRMLYDSPNHLKRVDLDEATAYCKTLGSDWQVYDGDRLFVASPNPKFDRLVYFWTGRGVGELDRNGIVPPKKFAGDSDGEQFAVLCINKRIR